MPEPTSFLAVEDLDAAGTLAAAEAAVRDRRAAELRGVGDRVALADLHANDPRDDGQPTAAGAAPAGPAWWLRHSDGAGPGDL